MARTGRKNRKGFEPVSAQNSHAPRMGDLTVADYANGMPNIRLGEMFKSFFRQMPWVCLLYTSPSPRDQRGYRMPSSA